MPALSDYISAALINAVLRHTTFPTAPATVYLALFTADPTSAGSQTNELTSGNSPNYSRVAVSTTGSFSAPSVSNGVTSTSNLNTISFPQAPSAWAGPITHVAVFDAATNGNMLLFGRLPTPHTLVASDILRFTPGAIVLSLT
jgi:hypothetical protein